MKVVKIATAGSVDDGKSTLIGRILYETNSLTEDKLLAIEEKSKINGFDYLDFSLATDGLLAEREQGITIDVAHIYFSHQNTSFIIADTPGHKEYTRNMITGASTSDASIILIDARKGVVEQTYRHFFITQLLQMKEIIVCVNKMDLVDYDQNKYLEIVEYVKYLAESFGADLSKIHFVPVSALKGENILNTSNEMPWFNGLSLISLIHCLEGVSNDENSLMRYPVQQVIRPKTEEYHDYRAYAGKVYGNAIEVGEKVRLYPSENEAVVSGISVFEGALNRASHGMSVSIELDRELNLSRGDLLVKVGEEPQVAKQIKAKLCWMNSDALRLGGVYLLQHGLHIVKAKVQEIQGVYDITKGELNDSAKSKLQLNEIGLVELKLSKPIYYDNFSESRSNGSFILIDTKSNNTAGLGFVV